MCLGRDRTCMVLPQIRQVTVKARSGSGRLVWLSSSVEDWVDLVERWLLRPDGAPVAPAPCVSSPVKAVYFSTVQSSAKSPLDAVYLSAVQSSAKSHLHYTMLYCTARKTYLPTKFWSKFTSMKTSLPTKTYLPSTISGGL